MERRLAAVLTADVVGYSRLMGSDEIGTLAALNSHLSELVSPRIRAHGGRIVKLMGDGLLAEFPSVVEAVQCAVEIQSGMIERSANVPEDRRLVFRIGVNVGDLIIEGDDIHGDGVNVAARLQALAEAGGICVREAVRDEVRDKLPYVFEDLGTVRVKNIARPIRTFRVRSGDRGAPGRTARGLLRLPRSAALAAAVVIAVGVAAFGWWSVPRLLEDGGGADWTDGLGEASIAVLPFSNLSPDPEQAFFADGLTDDLINDLANISGLSVIARTSVFAYKGRQVRVKDVGRELGVRYVLEGSVRRAGEAMRINTQLADAATGRQVWAGRYERAPADIFAVQEEIISEIVAFLPLTLSVGEEQRLTRVPTRNLEAYDAYLRAEATGVLSTDMAALQETLEHYREAIALDPEFADAYAGYAQANAEMWRLSYAGVVSPSVARSRAYSAASRALTLDPENGRAYGVLALMQLVDGRHADAIATARGAAALAPGDATSHATLAFVLSYAGEAEESLVALDQALRLAPNPSESLRTLAGTVYFSAGEHTSALRMLEGIGESGPKSEPGIAFLAAAYARAGQMERSVATIQRLIEVFPNVCAEYFRVIYDYYRDPEQLEDFVDAVASAGLPEWPFGFEPEAGDRVVGPDLREIAIGRTWRGMHHNDNPFIQVIDSRDRLVYRSAQTLVTGTVAIRNDELCVESEGLVYERQVCGEVYRRSDADGLPYAYVSPFELRYFKLTE